MHSLLNALTDWVEVGLAEVSKRVCDASSTSDAKLTFQDSTSRMISTKGV